MKQNKMGTQRESTLLLSMGWPIIISMLVQAFYNVVDSYFVSQLATLPAEALQAIFGSHYTAEVAATVGEKALTALTLVNPLQMLLISVAVGTAVGINSLISRRLGERRFDDANRAAGNGLVLSLLSAVVFCLMGLTLSRAFMQWQTNDPVVQKFGEDYMRICLCLCFGVFVSCSVERIMTAQGRTIFAMLMQLTGAVVNIALDRVFVLGAWFVPAMGVKGAAIATVIGQFASMALAIILLTTTKGEVRVRLRDFKLSRRTVGEIYRVGLPSILMQAVSTVMFIGMNTILTRLGEYWESVKAGTSFVNRYVSAFGVFFRLQSIIFMPVFGLNNAAMSILGYNFGARNRKRFLRSLWMLTLYCVVFMLLGTVAFQLFANQLMGIFGLTDDLHILRIISWGFVFAAADIALNTAFGATDTGLYAAIASLERQLLVLLPVAALFAVTTHSVEMVWWAFPISEVSTLIVSTLLFVRLNKKKIKPLDETLPLDTVATKA